MLLCNSDIVDRYKHKKLMFIEVNYSFDHVLNLHIIVTG